MITLDTSGLFELINRRSPNHQAVRRALEDDRGPFIVPVPILAEIAFIIETRLDHRVLDTLLGDLDRGDFARDCSLEDIPTVQYLVQRYGNLPLGFADASVIVCAERNGGRILTLDRRDFGVVARERPITLLPD